MKVWRVYANVDVEAQILAGVREMGEALLADKTAPLTHADVDAFPERVDIDLDRVNTRFLHERIWVNKHRQ